MDPHGEAILRIVRRVRTRAFLALLVRFAGRALVYSTPVPAAYLLLVGAPAPWALLQLSGVVGLISALAALAAWVKRPSLEKVARRIDSVLQLEQRVETAVGCMGDVDPVACLLRRDARASMHGVETSTVYRLDIGVDPRALGAVAILAGGIGLFGTYGGTDTPGLTRSVTWRPAATAGDVHSTGLRPETLEVDSVFASGGSAESKPDGNEKIESQLDSSPPPAETVLAALRSGSGQADLRERTFTDPDLPLAATPAMGSSSELSPAPGAASADRPVDSERDASGKREPTGSADQLQASSQATSRTAQGETERAIGAGPLSASAGAAGVSAQAYPTGGGAQGQTPGSPTEVDRVQRDLGLYHEQALMIEELPPGLRQYVKDYFTAIRSGEL